MNKPLFAIVAGLASCHLALAAASAPPKLATPPSLAGDSVPTQPSEPVASPADVALVKACLQADLAEAKIQLNAGANINAVVDGTSAIGGSALTGHFTLVAYLLNKGANPNTFGSNYPTPLTNAVESGNIDVVNALIHAGAKVNLGGGLGETPLMRATLNGNIPIIKLLLANGAKADLPNAAGDTPLLAAVSRGRTDVVKVLVSGGADLNSVTKSGYTPLLLATKTGQARVASFLLSSGAAADIAAVGGETPLTHSIRSADVPTLTVLLKSGANVNSNNGGGTTPLMIASSLSTTPQRIAILNTLLGKTAKVNATNDYKQTALMFATGFGAYDAAKMLLRRGADPTLLDRTGAGPLVYMAGGNMGRLALSKAPAVKPLNTTSEFIAMRSTAAQLAGVAPASSDAADALLIAAATGKVAMVQGLLDAKVPIDVTGTENVARMIPPGPDGAPARWSKGMTALMLASAQGMTGVVTELLNRGADKTLTADDGRTAVDFATDNHHDAIAGLLSQPSTVAPVPATAVVAPISKPSKQDATILIAPTIVAPK